MRSTSTIGFVVEGATDKDLVEGLASRVSPGLKLRFVRIGGRIAQRRANEVAEKLLDAGCFRVAVVVDADAMDQPTIRARRAELQGTIDDADLSEKVAVCLAVPEIEAWLLAQYADAPESYRNPKRELARIRRGWSPRDVAPLVRSMDLVTARHRSPSLDAFLRVLEEFAAPAS